MIPFVLGGWLALSVATAFIIGRAIRIAEDNK